ncbi:TPA: ead/Ea22-like family protein [Escherichia coli]|nr:ead/Ea22-like family protein [Escherichia coli]HCO8960848.1 ead/Ea22-like family protein [Escherichia coli]HDS9109793.1 ead/Ea22-like family protein [Escherichia coli]
MSEINYQALRELAKQATQGEWVAFISPGKYGTYAVHTPGDNHHGDIVDWPGFDEQKNAENNARYIAAFNPEVVQALLDEREAQSKRIAELEANFTELAAENVAMKLFIRGSCYVFDGEQDEISDAYICATDGGMPQTPATDAFLAEVRAQGVEMLAKNHQSIVNALKGDSLFSDDEYRHAAIVSAAVYFAAELRKGGSQ